jgi:hypothetical protein
MTNGNISDAAVYQARNADLVIVGQADAEHTPRGRQDKSPQRRR